MNNFNLETFGYQQQLNRSLNVMQLTAFGLNYMIPLSPAIFFGFVLAQSGGTVALPFIIAGIAIFFTAFSYSMMVCHFPLAGSLYNFVSIVWNKKLGFIASWVLLLDYLFISAVTSMSASLYVIQLIHIPYFVALTFFVLFTGIINILGIQIIAWLGLILLILAEFIVIASFIIWSKAIITHAGNFSGLLNLNAFHFTNIHTLMSATSLAIASYLGFDAITTLAEEAHEPLKSVPKAIFLCVFIGGIGMVLTGYLGVLACPHWQNYINNTNWQATALFQITKSTGGNEFAIFYSVGFIVSMAVFNIVAIAASARLLFGVARDNMIHKMFSNINSLFKTPHWNIVLIMVISLIVGEFSSVNEIANLVNFGALFGFAWLNLTVIYFYFKNKKNGIYQSSLKNLIAYIVLPLLGFIVVTWVFLSLDKQTHFVGSLWLLIGIVYLYYHQKSELTQKFPVKSGVNSDCSS